MSRLAERLERRTFFAITVFTIDPTLSAITLEGEAVGFNLKRQADGSLRARYDGAIVADYTPGASIRFLGGSDIIAETRGRFDPGNEPGNYAAESTQFGATIFEGVIRRLELDLLSDLLPVTGGNFVSSGEKVRVTRGRFTYDSPVSDDAFDLDGQEVANTTTGASTVQSGPDGVTRLTIPVDVKYSYSGASAELRLRGQVVATAGADNGLRPRVDANGSAFGTGFAGTFITGGAEVPAAATGDDALRVTDFDSATLTSATATLAARPDGAAEVLGVTVGGSGLASNYDSATGVLTVSGPGSTAVYQQVLGTLTYANGAATPTLGDRTITLSASDATGAGPAAASVISVEEPFNPNTVRLGDGENRSATFTDGDGTVTTVTLTGGGTATVRLGGATTQTTNRPGVVIVTGTGIQLLRLEAAGTGPLSRLNVKTVGGNGAVDLGGAVVEGALNTFGGKGVNATGTFDFNGRVNAASFHDLNTATLAAPSIGRLNVSGSIVGSTLTLEDPFNPLLPGLASLLLRGVVTNSRISAGGSIGNVKAAGLVNSEIYAGITGVDRFPSTAASFANEAVIKKVTLKAAPGVAAFDNSVIAANNLGRLNLGAIDTDNAGTPFGIAADTIAGVSGTGPAGQKLRLSKLDDPAILAATLPTLGFPFGDFQIRLM